MRFPAISFYFLVLQFSLNVPVSAEDSAYPTRNQNRFICVPESNLHNTGGPKSFLLKPTKGNRKIGVLMLIQYKGGDVQLFPMDVGFGRMPPLRKITSLKARQFWGQSSKKDSSSPFNSFSFCTDNRQFKVEFLFEDDHIRKFRIRDGAGIMKDSWHIVS